MRPKAARGRAQRAPTNLPECSRLFAGAALCSRPHAFPPEGGRWHGEAVTDEGAYLNRNLYPGGSPKGLPYPGPQSPPCQRGAAKRRGDFLSPPLSQRFLPMRVCARPAIGRTLKKSPPRRSNFRRGGGVSVSRESARRQIANEAVMLFFKR